MSSLGLFCCYSVPMSVQSAKIKAIILDVDGTLCPEVSWTALTRGLGASVDEHMTLFENFKNGLVDYPTAKKQLIQLWRATGKANKHSMKHIFSKWELHPGAQEMVESLSARYVTCIITGSFDIWAQTLADRLGVDHWYANTKFIWDDNCELVDMDYTLDQAERKLEHLRLFCQKQKVTPERCLAVGDSGNDVEIFKATGNGVAVGEAPAELAEVAAHRVSAVTDLLSILAA